MCNQIPQLILTEQKMAYALTDDQARVHTVCGDPSILWGRPNLGDGIGHSLLSLAPELAGCQGALEALLSGKIEELRFGSVHRQDGRGATHWVNLVVHPYQQPETGRKALLFVAQDVTEQGVLQEELMLRHEELRLLQNRLERQNVELAASHAELRLKNDIRSSFVSVAAHELRTPLTAIYGFLELLRDTGIDNLTSEQQDHLKSIEEGAERLLLTLNELLDAARIDSDRLDLVLRPTQIDEVIQAVVQILDPRLTARGQKLEIIVPPNLPHVLCDPERMGQVLGHLLDNASKFTPNGGWLKLAVQPVDSGDFLLLAVSDQGQGIGGGHESRLFDPFYRGESAHKNGKSGVGLGLYITRSLVELHGGEICFESAPERGATFYITVPVARRSTTSVGRWETVGASAVS